MAAQLRAHDRNIHKTCYPMLHYPQVFVIEGGYRDFYEKYPDLCSEHYVPMLAAEHHEEMEKCSTEYAQKTAAFDKLLVPQLRQETHRQLISEPRHRSPSPVSQFMSSFAPPGLHRSMSSQ
jgi:hypothetical protein